MRKIAEVGLFLLRNVGQEELFCIVGIDIMHDAPYAFAPGQVLLLSQFVEELDLNKLHQKIQTGKTEPAPSLFALQESSFHTKACMFSLCWNFDAFMIR